MKIRLEYNNTIGWLHFSNLKDPVIERSGYVDIVGKPISIEYAIAFQEYMEDKVNKEVHISNVNLKRKCLSIEKMKQEITNFLTERKLND